MIYFAHLCDNVEIRYRLKLIILEVSGGHEPHASVKYVAYSIVTKMFSIATAVPRMTHPVLPTFLKTSHKKTSVAIWLP